MLRFETNYCRAWLTSEHFLLLKMFKRWSCTYKPKEKANVTAVLSQWYTLFANIFVNAWTESDFYRQVPDYCRLLLSNQSAISYKKLATVIHNNEYGRVKHGKGKAAGLSVFMGVGFHIGWFSTSQFPQLPSSVPFYEARQKTIAWRLVVLRHVVSCDFQAGARSLRWRNSSWN